ncbi:DNA-directed RNA polymerase I subunit rpa1 [Drechslerella dactyloides]|uniref:DNA-directed RNA polymerase n=1 Tax=Drechslerella dactyloides TaxID=74499 RepID=A0AAD6IPZ8_DREDA|nr:DNA-directed RNA polymerase I subunit rpa1 [Drechslerella dactyloides]
MNISNPISSEIKTVHFGFLFTKDILSISVKQIVNPSTFDVNGNPVDGGLYDPALGPFGRSIAECENLELIGLKKFSRSEPGLTNATDVGDVVDDLTRDDEDMETVIRQRSRYVRKLIRSVTKSSNSDDTQVMAVAQARKAVVHDFLKLVVGIRKCNSCKGVSPTYRKDGYSKIFQRPLSAKEQQQMALLGLRVKHSLSSKAAENAANGSELYKKSMEVDNGPFEPRPTIEPVEPVDSNMGEAETSSEESTASKSGTFLPPMEVLERLSGLFANEADILSLIYGHTRNTKAQRGVDNQNDATMFFLQAVLVPPTPFRAPSFAGNELNENPQNSILKKILDSSIRIRDINRATKDGLDRKNAFGKLIREFINLQDSVNLFIDSTKGGGAVGARQAAAIIGIKQILEKKEGLFRKNMMGKRVNYAARSVISPDPNIETNEIGIPLVFAKKLTYPEPVTPHNVDVMRQAVINGPNVWPGATHIENENGRLQRLPMAAESRKALANQLLTPSEATLKSYNKKVYRHLRNGDMVIMNRQPTLHKPSMMGHKARVLHRENTIRMHYANCNTYNADFDGDEMNLHLPQNENARAEAQFIANTDSQYLVPTSGKPLRGLIQDHIVMSLHMTQRDSLFTRGEYQELLHACLRPEDNLETTERIQLIAPAILKPVRLWTGKQIITTILENVRPAGTTGISFASKTKVPGSRWGEKSEEGEVVFDNGYFVCGVLDKSQVGASAYGIVHSVHELYGPATAGSFLSILGRLFTKLLHMRAFSCGMEDLVFGPQGDHVRREALQQADSAGATVAKSFAEVNDSTDDSVSSSILLSLKLEEILRNDSKQQMLDGLMSAKGDKLTSQVIKSCLPNHLTKPFPRNQMQAMTVSGAKGSDVNASQISCLLGQQVLEGRRVPVMISGKTLPSFSPFDPGLRAGGYVTGRFLTGIRPQEYYFHAMAGREGLIDTAVKTSRSGYLQRCLIKGMEGIRTHYDASVRDSDGSLVQFLYGEDGIDIGKQAHLSEFAFHAKNQETYIERLGGANLTERLDFKTALDYSKDVAKLIRKAGSRRIAIDPAISVYSPGRHVGSVSESFADDLEKFVKENPGQCLQPDKKNKKLFKNLMYLKYLRSLISPGEAVAGHAAKNVTLGIPRLREIVMTASATIATPIMTLTLNENVTDNQAAIFAKSISRLSLSEIVKSATVTETVGQGRGFPQAKVFKIKLEFYPSVEYEEEYSTTIPEIFRAVQTAFIPKLCSGVSREFRKMGGASVGANDSIPTVGTASKVVNEGQSGHLEAETNEDDRGEGDDSDDENDADQDAKQSSRKADASSYDEPDDDEKGILDEMSASDESDVDADDDDGDRDTKMTGEGGIDDATSSESERDDETPRDLTKNELTAAIEELQSDHSELAGLLFDRVGGGWCQIELEYPPESPKILMVSIVEKACRDSVIHHLPGIKTCEVVADGSPTKQLSVDGVNFHAIWDYGHVIDSGAVYSNDIAAVLRVYGVECARNTIIREMDGVFKGHGIAVDGRHLNLIADIMTRNGGFSPFNRTGLAGAVSPLMKMSFETTCNFLKEASLAHEHDELKSPSARIVFGRLQNIGTGSFGVLGSQEQQARGSTSAAIGKLQRPEPRGVKACSYHPSSYHTFDHFPPSSSSLIPKSPSAASRSRHMQASSRAQGYYGAPSGSAGSRTNPRSLPPYISLQRPSEPASPATIATTISSHSTPSPSPSRPPTMPATISNTDFTLFDDAMMAAAQDVANDSVTKARSALDVSSSMSDNSSGLTAYAPSGFPIIVPHDVPYSNYAQSAIYGNYSSAGNDVPSNFYTLGPDEQQQQQQSSGSQQSRQNQQPAARYLHPLPYSTAQKVPSTRHSRSVASQLKNMEVEPIENVPALSPTSRRQGNYLHSGTPASPHLASETVADNTANPRYSSGASICEGNNHSIISWIDEYLQEASDMHPPMPKLGRTYSDAVQDELYNPEPPRDLPDYTKKTPAWYGATSAETKGDGPHSFQRIFHEAQQQHQRDLSQSGSPQNAGGDRSPFRRNSPFHPTNNPNLPHALDQQNQIAMAMALREQMRKEAEQTVAPKTISPRDSLLEYREPDSQQSQMALFPPLQDNRLLGTQDDSMSHVGSLHGASSHDGSDLDDFQSMATSRRASMANSTVSSHLDVPRFGYMQQPSFDPISAGAYYYPDTTSPLAASSLPLSEAPGVYIKEEMVTGGDHHIARPLDTSANTGTYTCTYSGCGQRFTTSTKLQKHRREAHRKSVPSGNSVSTAAAIACRNAQPGPHRCMRVNPSTGKPCNTVFSRPYDLTRHEDTIHNTAKAKVRCEICDDDKFFSRSDALVRHRRVKHGIH